MKRLICKLKAIFTNLTLTCLCIHNLKAFLVFVIAGNLILGSPLFAQSKGDLGTQAGYASISNISYTGIVIDGYKVFVKNNINGPIYFPSFDVLPVGGAWMIGIEIFANGGDGTYYLNIKSEPPSPWNAFFGTILEIGNNESAHKDMVNFSYETFGMGLKCPDYTDYPTQYLVLEVKEQVLLTDPVHQSKNIQLIADTYAPDTYVLPLPITQTNTSFNVSWDGSDKGSTSASNGPSGISKYDVLYRVNNGGWQYWQTGTSATNATFTGTYGNTYYFQSVGHDNVGNTEPYPSGNGDTYTSLQPPPTLSVSPTSLNVGSASGSTGNISVTSNTSWSVSDDAAWLTVSPTSGSGNGSVTVSTSSANTSTSSRAATVTFSASGVSSATLTVTQSGTSATLSVSPTSLNVGSASGSAGNISVTSNTSWSVSDDAAWLTVSPTSGSGNGSVTVSTSSANTSTSSRAATVTFSASGVSSTAVTVTQLSAPNNKECNTLSLTKGQYTESENLNTKIQSEFGENFSIADWTDLKAISNINEWISCIGLSEDQTFLLTNSGAHFIDVNKHYYVHYSSDGIPYSGFLLHDQIGGLYLGAWYGITTNVLAKNLITSIPDTKSLNIKVYPNPANREVMLESDVLINNVQVLNMLGSVLVEKSTIGQQLRIDLSQLSTGNYFIIISTEKGIVSKNLVVFR